MDLADLVDLECLIRDGSAPGGARAERARAAVDGALQDAGIAPPVARATAQSDPAIRQHLLTAIVHGERAAGEAALPGAAVAAGFTFVGVALAILGVLLGVSTAGLMLAYDGSTPVNVLPFVIVLFAGQILTLALTVWFLGRALGAENPGPSRLHGAIGALVRRFAGERGRAAAAAFQAARTRHALLADIETWTLFALVQRFAVAFNVGVFATAMFRIATSDLVFGWATTLDVEPATVHGMVRGLAAPWSLLFPGAVPDAEVVAASQWSRMQGAFVSAEGVAEPEVLAREWWAFLVAGIFVYGLVPRSLAWVLGAWRARRARAALRFDDAGSERLLDGALPATTGWQAPDAAAVRGPAPAGVAVRRGAEPTAVGVSAAVLAWGSLAPHAEVLRQFIGRRFGARVHRTFAVGGAELTADDTAVATLSNDRVERAWLVCAAGQQPTKDILGFVRDLRVALGSGRTVAVLLVAGDPDRGFTDAEPDELAAWERSLGALEDPHLWVGRLEAAR